MSPPNLQGLNIVHPAQSSNQYLSDDLLTLPHYPELSAQLDLWTNLSFESDEPLVHHKKDKDSEQSPASLEDLDREDEEEAAGPARAENHDNVVLGHPIHEPRSSEPKQQQQQQQSQPPLDLSAILATFGVDPYTIPASYQQPPPSAAPSLAQILALYPSHANGFPQPLPPLLIPPSGSQPELDSQNEQPSSKRARTRKASVSTSISADDTASPSTIAFSIAPGGSPNSSLTPAEDKRRRNTAASARFRLKKKEREAALEKKAKELEVRVTELERECEGLRRENGWLKGLVVGVTGVGAQQATNSGPGTGTKRSREEETK